MLRLTRSIRRFSDKAVDLSAVVEITSDASAKFYKIDPVPISATEARDLPAGSVGAVLAKGQSIMDKLDHLRIMVENQNVTIATLDKKVDAQNVTIQKLENKVARLEGQLSGLISDQLFIKLFESWKLIERKLILKHFPQFSVLNVKRKLTLSDIQAENSDSPEASAFMKDHLVIQAYQIRISSHFKRLKDRRNMLAHDFIETVEDFEATMHEHNKVEDRLDLERAAFTKDLKAIPFQKFLKALRNISVIKQEE